jgi:hypothetical protein
VRKQKKKNRKRKQSEHLLPELAVGTAIGRDDPLAAFGADWLDVAERLVNPRSF